ncbi:hypothetical protein Plhal304r1_c004g0017051 [Plasmopara halstedii]
MDPMTVLLFFLFCCSDFASCISSSPLIIMSSQLAVIDDVSYICARKFSSHHLLFSLLNLLPSVCDPTISSSYRDADHPHAIFHHKLVRHDELSLHVYVT